MKKPFGPICLIIPPSVFLLDERVFINLGILKVAAVLEQEGYLVEVLDLSGVANYELVLKLHLDGSPAVVFGITATTPQLPAVMRIQSILRERRPKERIIIGGPHPTLVLAAYRREHQLGQEGRAHRHLQHLLEAFDVIVAGDGENTVVTALTTTERIIDADDPKSPLFMTHEGFDKSPFPARHLVEVSSYHYEIEGERALSLIAQLGCPFACGFCSGRTSPSLRNIRLRSTESVVREVEHLYDVYNVKAFMFYDDELNVNPKMLELMMALTALQKRRGVQFKLRGCIKAQLFTDAQAAAMAEAGFRIIFVGFESGHPRILENINKKATREENTRCVEIARRHGLKVKASMSIGHPGESLESILATRDWLLEAKPDDFNVTVITCTPGTFYYDHAVQVLPDPEVWTYTVKNGDRLHSRDIDYRTVSDYYNGRPTEYRSFVYTDYVSAEDLVRLRDDIEYEVRQKLRIPFSPTSPSLFFDHSMGQTGLPPNVLRTNWRRVRWGPSVAVAPVPRAGGPVAPPSLGLPLSAGFDLPRVPHGDHGS